MNPNTEAAWLELEQDLVEDAQCVRYHDEGEVLGVVLGCASQRIQRWHGLTEEEAARCARHLMSARRDECKLRQRARWLVRTMTFILRGKCAYASWLEEVQTRSR